MLRVTLHVLTLCSVAAVSAGPLDDPQNCQSFDDTLLATISSPFYALASDDFVADGSALSQVRVWGFYYKLFEGGDCAPPQTVDHFRVRVLENDPVIGRRPEADVGTSSATSLHLAVPGTQVEAAWGSVMYQIDLTLQLPISGLTAGQVYWLEVSNEPTNSVGQPVSCEWFWIGKTQTSSSYSFWSSTEAGNCSSGIPLPFDQAFCANFGIGQSSVGAMPGACCTCDGVCGERTLKDCEDEGGTWDIERNSCVDVVCDATPLNDNCADSPPLVSEGHHVIPQYCATTDGYGPIVTEYSSPTQIEGDVWYKFIAPANCELVINTCWSGQCIDSVLAVYHQPDNPTVCPPCALANDPNGAQISQATLAGSGKDDNCTPAVGGGGYWEAVGEIGREPIAGECFFIRAGSFGIPERNSAGILQVDCLNIPPALEPDPSGVNKSRFISFVMPVGTTGETAIRINMIDLHRIPYFCELCYFPFTLFEGLDLWVGPPVEYSESSSTGIPFLASTAQCTPHYRDWSTVGLLHVTGTAIVPGSTYHVEQVASTCMGREGDADCQPAGANVSSRLQIRTTRWADVVAPFSPPSLTVQPDLGDVSALVDKFRNLPGAPIKAQALLAGADAFGSIDIATDFGFQHISACVDAFRGQPYIHRMGRCTGSNTACRLHGDCPVENQPCELYCP